MTFFTKKGDDGTTCAFDCDLRFSKSSIIAEALGAVDEINSYLGIIKTAKDSLMSETVVNKSLLEIVEEIQQNLFIVQAEISGAEKNVTIDKVADIEDIINSIEKIIPPIRNFIVAGGTNLSALFDFARTLARRAERVVVSAKEEEMVKINGSTLAYLNRLSSLLYALARLSCHLSGINEGFPTYS